MKTYYKVVICRSHKDLGLDGELISVAAPVIIKGPASKCEPVYSFVHYRVDEWVESKQGNGPLCVFSDLYHATAFHTDMEALVFPSLRLMKLQIYECEIEVSAADEIWVMDGARKLSRGLDTLSVRTVLANRVRLTKKVA